MKSLQILLIILLIPAFTNAQLAYLNNNGDEQKEKSSVRAKKEVAAPRFLPKNSMDTFVDFNFKTSAATVDLKWRFSKSMQNKTVHLLKGVMNENHQIKWEIVEEYGPLSDEDIKFKYKDKSIDNQTTYYRLRISEDGDSVEYTGYYKIS